MNINDHCSLAADLADHVRKHGPKAHAVILEALADAAGLTIASCHAREDATMRFVARVIFHADQYLHDDGEPHQKSGPSHPRCRP